MWLYNSAGIFLLSYYFIDVVYFRLRKRTLIKNIRKFMQLTLIILGIYSAEVGSFKEVSSFIILGILYIPIMVAFNSSTIRALFKFRFRIIMFFKTIIIERKKYFVIGWRVLNEELVWRCSFIFLMNYFVVNNINIIVIGSVLFYLIHVGFSKKIIIISELEFLTFIFILYISFSITKSLAGIWFLHFLRNGYITFIKEWRSI